LLIIFYWKMPNGCGKPIISRTSHNFSFMISKSYTNAG
jgi:hypothetical protein